MFRKVSSRRFSRFLTDPAIQTVVFLVMTCILTTLILSLFGCASHRELEVSAASTSSPPFEAVTLTAQIAYRARF